MVQKGISGRIHHSTYRYVKANNKYMKTNMKNYDEHKKSSYLQYWDVNNGWAM